METPTIPARRADALDAEKFGEMIRSESFALFVARVRAEFGRQQETCVKSDVELEIRRAQGSVAALAMMLGLPEIMLAEMKSKPRYISQPIARKASNSRV